MTEILSKGFMANRHNDEEKGRPIPLDETSKHHSILEKKRLIPSEEAVKHRMVLEKKHCIPSDEASMHQNAIEKKIMLPCDEGSNHLSVAERRKVFEWKGNGKAIPLMLESKDNKKYSWPRLLPILVVLCLLCCISLGVWAILHPRWILTSGQVTLPPIKLPLTKKSIVSILSLKLDMALYKVCMDLNVTVASHHLTELEKSFLINISECYDKNNIPHGMDRDKMFRIMIDFIYILVCLLSGTIHSFISKVLLLIKQRKECCFTHYIVILICCVISVVSSITGIVIANRRLTKDAKFFYDMVDMSTTTPGHASNLLAAVKKPLLNAIQDSYKRGPAFDVAMSFAVFSVVSFVMLVILVISDLVSKRKKISKLSNRTNI